LSNPTLTTTITSPEPHIVGKYITFTSLLRSQTGDPIPDEQVSFRTPTQILGTLSTNASGIIYFAIGVPQTPGTFEIYSTHTTDDNILIESNHVIFTTEEPTVEQCTQQFRFEDQNGNPVSGTLSITGTDFDVTGDISLSLEQGKEYLARAVVGDVPIQKAFTACTDQITFVFTTAEELPTLTTSITSDEPYIAGTTIDLKTILKSPTGVPISGKSVFFYKQTEYLGGGFTNANGELSLQFQTEITPTTYEIHTTHLADGNIVIESNHVIFTTEEASVEPCHQGFRLEDQNGNPISGIITISGEDHHILGTGEISLPLTEGQSYIAVAKVGTLIKQHTFIACTPQIIFQFTIEEYTPTSLTISIDPTELVPGQYSDITGKLTIQGQDTVPSGIPLKLYCDKGQGYQVIHTPTTPPSSTGTVTVQYGAQQEDVGKSLKFKYGYDGSDTPKLNPSESGIVEISVVETHTTIDTPEYTGSSGFIPVICGTIIGLGILGLFIIRR